MVSAATWLLVWASWESPNRLDARATTRVPQQVVAHPFVHATGLAADDRGAEPGLYRVGGTLRRHEEVPVEPAQLLEQQVLDRVLVPGKDADMRLVVVPRCVLGAVDG